MCVTQLEILYCLCSEIFVKNIWLLKVFLLAISWIFKVFGQSKALAN